LGRLGVCFDVFSTAAGADERLERGLIDLVALAEVDGAPCAAVEAGVERPLGSSSAAPLAKVVLT